VLRDAEPLGDGFDLVMADIAIVEDGNLALGRAQVEEQLFPVPVAASFTSSAGRIARSKP
jgi:hypothetical protein